MTLIQSIPYIYQAVVLNFTDRSTDTTVFTAMPCEYLGYYRIRFDYKVTVKTLPPTNNMIFSIQNTGAFTYMLIKTLLNTKSILGEHIGAVDFTIQATKNTGVNMNFMFRPYSGVADCELTNVRVEKVG